MLPRIRIRRGAVKPRSKKCLREGVLEPIKAFPMADSKIDVSYVAHLARLKLSAEETARFQKQLGDVLQYVDKLQQADVSSVVPAEDAADFRNNLRPDEERPGLPVADALSNAPQQGNNLFLVPRMVE